MAVIIKVLSTGKGDGVSELTKSISESRRHPEKERETRELFGQKVDGLKNRSASRHLTRGSSSQVEKRDVFYFVISPEAKEFEQSGQTDDDRKKVYREATRSTMREIEKQVGAIELRWVAAIHLNTKTPHVHVLVHKDFYTKEGLPRRFHRLPNLNPHKTDPAKLLHNRFMQNLHQARKAKQVKVDDSWLGWDIRLGDHASDSENESEALQIDLTNPIEYAF